MCNRYIHMQLYSFQRVQNTLREKMAIPSHGRSQDFFRGKPLGSDLWGRGRRRIVENFHKSFSRKLRKCIILAYFSKMLKKYELISRGLWTKNTICWKTFESIRKLSKGFLRKLRKCIILAYLS